MKYLVTLVLPLLLLFVGLLGALPAFSQESPAVKGRFVVRSQGEMSERETKNPKRSLKTDLLSSKKIGNIEIWEVDVKKYAKKNAYPQALSFVEHMQTDFGLEIEPDYIFSSLETPDDPYFPDQWAAANTGQQGGKKGADIGLLQAWEITQGSEEIIAGIIDTGIDYGHEDLKDNIWQNLSEDADGDGTTIEWINGAWALDPGDLDGIDADGNGYIDDLVGWDFVNNDNDPFDDNGHGTHVAGILGAKGNNGMGIAGVCWSAKMMALKAFDSEGSGSLSSILPALAYARKMGVNFTNNSWGGSSYSQFLYKEIKQADREGQLLIAAAGNAGVNLMQGPIYPASYDLPNIISVAATDRQDQLASFSNYCAASVDIAAPGVSIMSTLPGNQYGLKSGTSMAAPMVSGTIGLILSHAKDMGHLAIKDLLLTTVDLQSSLENKCTTGGRINASKSLQISSELCLDWVQETKGHKIKSFVVDDLYIWAATDKGLLLLPKNNCEIIHYKKGNSPLEDDKLLCVTKGRNEELWIGSEKKGLYKIEDGEWTRYHKGNSGLLQNKINTILVDSEGIWVAAYDKGLSFFDGSGWITYDKDNSGLPDDKIFSLLQATDGSLWIGTERGLAHFDNGQWTVIDETNSPLPDDKILSLAQEPDGTFWIGTDKGLARWGSEGWEIWDEANSGLPDDKILSITFGPNSAKWIGTGKGLSRYNGSSWVLFDEASLQLPHDKVNALETDALNNTWIGTDDGIQLFSNQASVTFSGPAFACIDQSVDFKNHSYGADAYQWIVDSIPVSTDQELSYQFTEPGEHEVQLIGTNTYSSNEFSLIVYVPEPPTANLGNDTSICAPAFVLDGGTKAQNYQWQDVNGQLLGTERVLSVQQSGTYILTLSNACHVTSTDSLDLTLTSGCVQPGDVNADGRVNMIDYLALGTAEGATGPARTPVLPGSDTQLASDWPSSFSPTHQLAANVNHKHADSDGNGVVDLVVDGAIIQQQANYIHEIDNTFDPNGLQLSLKPIANIFEGDSVVRLTYEISLSGSGGQAVSDVYGLSMGLSVNYQLSEAPVISTEGSWLGATSSMIIHHEDLNPNASQSIELQGRRGAYSEIGLLKNGIGGDTGSGMIASASIVISIDDITEDPNLMDFFSFSLTPINVTIIDQAGNMFPVQASKGSSLGILDILSDSTFSGEQIMENKQSHLTQLLSIYPNPATDHIQFEYNTAESGNMNVRIWNMIGQQIHQSEILSTEGQNILKLPVDTWMDGIYIVELFGNGKRYQAKVQVSR